MAYTANAEVSRSRGNRSVIIEVAQGLSTASPLPTPTRAASRCQKFCAIPQAAVASDHTDTPAKMIQRRLKRSASAPATRPNTENATANAAPCRIPNCMSLMPRSRLIGSTTSEMMKRSRIESQYRNASAIVAYQATARAGYGASGAPLALASAISSVRAGLVQPWRPA